MHYLGLYIHEGVIEDGEEFNAEDCNSYAYSDLVDGGFASQSIYNNAIADWFVIGGRWSGLFTELLTGEEQPNRDAYENEGYPDDSIILTEELYKKIRERFRELTFIQEGWLPEEAKNTVNLKDHIGKAITIIDYHD